jgi:hypothetical protein
MMGLNNYYYRRPLSQIPATTQPTTVNLFATYAECLCRGAIREAVAVAFHSESLVSTHPSKGKGNSPSSSPL